MLNESADTFATKGVMNEQAPWGEHIQYITRLCEDTNKKTYVLKDGEETLTDDRDLPEPGKTYI
jgi:hypothetical protein